MIIRRTLLAAAALGLAGALPAWAQDYPSRTITIVAGAAAGGPTDVITRLVAEAMSKHLPQPVVVENIGPAHVGAQRVAQSRPDGYMLLMTNVGMAAGATLFRRLAFDTLNRGINKALTSPDVVERLTKLGMDPVTSTPDEFAKIVASDYAKWGPIVKASGFTAD